jgi:hypothetical protein
MKRRIPTGLAQSSTPYAYRPVLAEDFSTLILLRVFRIARKKLHILH